MSTTRVSRITPYLVLSIKRTEMRVQDSIDRVVLKNSHLDAQLLFEMFHSAKTSSVLVIIMLALCFLSNRMEVEGGVYRKPCQIICPQTLIYAPVCGTDGVTYTSQCYLDGKNRCDGTNIGKAYDGECKAYY